MLQMKWLSFVVFSWCFIGFGFNSTWHTSFWLRAILSFFNVCIIIALCAPEQSMWTYPLCCSIGLGSCTWSVNTATSRVIEGKEWRLSRTNHLTTRRTAKDSSQRKGSTSTGEWNASLLLESVVVLQSAGRSFNTNGRKQTKYVDTDERITGRSHAACASHSLWITCR